MTTLYAQTLTLPVAGFGPENPLPPLRGHRDPHRVDNLDALPPDLAEGIGYGGLGSVLPYLDQDGYDRTLRDQDVPTLVLENDHLRATVLPGLGGRLHSLLHKPSEQELLHRNPVIQPANLALRNAWFAGGVEWNLGSTGHWAGTCAPLHAARVDGPDGTPVLRLWEWERTRNLVLQLDLWLPDDSELLYVGARIQNPSPGVVPAYWWSNIAVEQTPGTRVLVPAEQAWRFGYGDRLDLVEVPAYDGIDLSYPARHRRAVDFFFEPVPGQRPWIAALDADGNGLVQASTERLRGRKLFVWGEGRGGRRWQEWLSPGSEGTAYCEIQAGLARTQLEHLKLPGATDWTWLEAYGRLSLEPAVAHGDWTTARAAANDALADRLADLDDRERAWLEVADTAPVEELVVGSGWGALELRRTGWTVSAGTPFADRTMTARERAWLPVLDGRMPVDGDTPPDGTLVGWRDLLEGAEDNWLTWYHRGVARWYDGDVDGPNGAVAAWRRSGDNPWALRNLAVATGDLAAYERAVELRPDLVVLLVEAVTAALAVDVARAGAILDRAPDDPRLRVLRVRYLLATGDAAGAQRLLDGGIELPGVREGANPLAELWRETQARLGTHRPVPAAYEFGMGGA